MFLNAAVTATFFWFLSHIYHSFPALWTRTTSQLTESPIVETAQSSAFIHQTNDTEDTNVDDTPLVVKEYETTQSGDVCIEEDLSTPSSRVDNGTVTGFFFSSGCAGTMISYSALYFTVLSFSSLMTVYLKWAGMPVSWIGALRGVGAITGFLGAVLFPFCQHSIGVEATGLYSIWYQVVFVVIAASSFFWANPLAVSFIISVSVLLSRAGLWMFDLAATQIAQLRIEERSRGTINGQWRSITAFFDALTYVVAIFLSNPKDFNILCVLSASSVFAAAVIYSSSEFDFLRIPGICNGHYSRIPDSPGRSTQSNDSQDAASSVKSIELLIPELEPTTSTY